MQIHITCTQCLGINVHTRCWVSLRARALALALRCCCAACFTEESLKFFDGFSSRGRTEIVSIDFIFGRLRSSHLVRQYTLLSSSRSHTSRPWVSLCVLVLVSFLWYAPSVLSPTITSLHLLDTSSLNHLLIYTVAGLSSSSHLPECFSFLWQFFIQLRLLHSPLILVLLFSVSSPASHHVHSAFYFPACPFLLPHLFITFLFPVSLLFFIPSHYFSLSPLPFVLYLLQ